jgi:hypothetical protein
MPPVAIAVAVPGATVSFGGTPQASTSPFKRSRRGLASLYGSTVPKTELDDFVKRVAPAFSKYANIGIRIEDDILITNSGNENLSQAIPKQPEAIERLMNKK